VNGAEGSGSTFGAKPAANGARRGGDGSAGKSGGGGGMGGGGVGGGGVGGGGVGGAALAPGAVGMVVPATATGTAGQSTVAAPGAKPQSHRGGRRERGGRSRGKPAPV